MGGYNSDFWEVPYSNEFLENLPASRSPWYETEEDVAHREAMRQFRKAVGPIINDLTTTCLTRRQREVVKLYYFHGKSQEEIATILNLTQSTVSRHLFGTVRDGKKVGGAIRKFRKAIEGSVPIRQELEKLQARFAQAS